MANVPADLPIDNLDEKALFLSTLPPGRALKRAALFVVLPLIVAFFIADQPLATVRLPRIEAFVPAHTVEMVLSGAITAALLLCRQFLILRSRALVFIACDLFAALMSSPWMIAFSGIFTADPPPAV